MKTKELIANLGQLIFVKSKHNCFDLGTAYRLLAVRDNQFWVEIQSSDRDDGSPYMENSNLKYSVIDECHKLQSIFDMRCICCFDISLV